MESTSKKVNKERLISIRRGLHEDIFSEVSETEHKTLKIIREPNISKKQPAPKVIIAVETDEQAKELKTKCLNLIEHANNNIKNELEGSKLTRYEIKYNVNIIHSTSDLILSIHSAQRRRKTKGIELKKKLEQVKEILNVEASLTNSEETAIIINYIDKCIKEICDTNYYILAEATGNSYRITYFNGEYREQISVGNLLIVVSSGDVQIVNAPERKQRTDKKEELYFIKTGFCTLYVYPV